MESETKIWTYFTGKVWRVTTDFMQAEKQIGKGRRVIEITIDKGNVSAEELAVADY